MDVQVRASGQMCMFSVAISDYCLLCGKERETVDNLYLHCEFSYFYGVIFLGLSGVLWYFPELLIGIFETWRGSPFFGFRLVLWRRIPLAILLFVWKEKECLSL